MIWSTRQLADLAGTTLKTVRHYHEIGLLEMPARSVNGYKQYEIKHLVRLLKIRRLTDLGVPLSQISAMGDLSESSDEALHALDTELGESIERLQRLRDEVSEMLLHRTPTDLPTGFTVPDLTMSDADRALVLIYSRVLSPRALDDLREMLIAFETTPEGAAFDALGENSDDETRQRLAEDLVPQVRELTARHNWFADPRSWTGRNPGEAQQVIAAALVDLYNPAQLDVLRRLGRLMVVPANDSGGDGESS